MSMNVKEKTYIYHIYRQDGTSLFLHPFTSPAKLIALIERSEIEGKYGREPRVESLTLFRNELYRMIENGVKEWVSELRFIPKFLISSAVFLFTYLFLSLVVRDPVPVFDEIVLGLAASVAVYLVLGRKDMRSDLVLKKRVALRSVVDRIMFTESDFIRDMEALLHETETRKVDDVLEYLMHPGGKVFSDDEAKDARQLLQYLERRFEGSELKRKERLVLKLSRENQGRRAQELVSRWLSTEKIDLPLFILYTRVKNNVEKVG